MSTRQLYPPILIVVIFGSLLSGFFYVRRMQALEPTAFPAPKDFPKNTEVSGQIGETTLTLELAESPLARMRGLSQRESLPDNHGVLFDFQHPAYPAMWMKDMKFAIDFIWVDESQRVVGITPEVAPETYPQTFTASSPVRYVIEVNKGWAARHNIAAGATVLW